MNKDELILKFYNRINQSDLNSTSQIPVDIRLFLIDMDHNALAKPFVKEELRKQKKGYKSIGDIYGVCQSVVFNIRKKVMV